MPRCASRSAPACRSSRPSPHSRATPARAIGRAQDLGTLAPGFLADAVLLSADLAVRGVWVAGSGVRRLTRTMPGNASGRCIPVQRP